MRAFLMFLTLKLNTYNGCINSIDKLKESQRAKGDFQKLKNRRYAHEHHEDIFYDEGQDEAKF